MTRTANRKELFVYGFFFSNFFFGGKILSLKADPLRRGFAYLQGKHYFATSASCAVANSLATVDNRIGLLHVGIAIKFAEILRSTAAQTFPGDFSESAQTFPRDFSEYERTSERAPTPTPPPARVRSDAHFCERPQYLADWTRA